MLYSTIIPILRRKKNCLTKENAKVHMYVYVFQQTDQLV